LIDSSERWELRFLSGEKLVTALGSISSFIFRDALGGLRVISKNKLSRNVHASVEKYGY
jgi:hypothetical protein